MNTLKILLWKEWKESRLNFIFAVAVIIILKMLQLYIASLPESKGEELVHSNEGLAFVALLFCSIYGLISGIGMFAMEYTTRTLPYLMSRPVPKISVLSSKWLVGVCELLALGFVAWFLAGRIDLGEVVAIVHFPLKSQPLLLLVFCLYPMCLYFLAVLCSLIFKDTTRSTVAAFIMVIVLISLFVKLASVIHFTPDNSMWIDFSAILCLIFLFVLSSTLLFLRQQIK